MRLSHPEPARGNPRCDCAAYSGERSAAPFVEQCPLWVFGTKIENLVSKFNLGQLGPGLRLERGFEPGHSRPARESAPNERRDALVMLREKTVDCLEQ